MLFLLADEQMNEGRRLQLFPSRLFSVMALNSVKPSSCDWLNEGLSAGDCLHVWRRSLLLDMFPAVNLRGKEK